MTSLGTAIAKGSKPNLQPGVWCVTLHNLHVDVPQVNQVLNRWTRRHKALLDLEQVSELLGSAGLSVTQSNCTARRERRKAATLFFQKILHMLGNELQRLKILGVEARILGHGLSLNVKLIWIFRHRKIITTH